MAELGRLVWKGDACLRLTEAETRRRLKTACIMVEITAKENLMPGGASGFKTSQGGSGLRGSVHYETEELTGRIGSNLKYARIQELGGITHPTVTPKMRRWSWVMFRETGEGKYKGIALTKKANLTVIIPPRPYLRPALWNNETAIRELFARPMK